MTSEMNVCEMCKREALRLTKHHLIPRTRHKNKKNKRNFSRQEVKERLAMLCRNCHSAIHAFLSNKELEYEYNTIEKLLQHPEVSKFVSWLQKQPAGVRVRTFKSK
ncbi:HNH endonuclease [Candidatus Uabimicrobium sp. HlEnr_7]|uniref:HNH endonuclease n=1 Tax=Candidatus Uabimicrobium helgolandensis TaxID=3095367 RepID=UPI003558A447